MYSVQREKLKKGKKWSILSLYTKLMLSIQGVRDFWHFFQVILEKLNRKCVIKSIRKYLDGEKKEKLILFLESFLLTKYTC
jgi:hypothetical protein